MMDFIGTWYPVLGFLAIAAMLWYNHITYVKWFNHPDTVRERQKTAYEAAHTYKEGTCCCGRNTD